MLSVSLVDRILNKIVHQRTNVKGTRTKIRIVKFKLTGHFSRCSDDAQDPYRCCYLEADYFRQWTPISELNRSNFHIEFYTFYKKLIKMLYVDNQFRDYNNSELKTSTKFYVANYLRRR